jgi:cytochrome P450
MTRFEGRLPGSEDAKKAVTEFDAITAEMNEYLAGLLEERRTAPKDDLLTRLLQAEVEDERLTQLEILGFFQLLLLAGSETTTNLINNAVLCFIENPEQLARLKAAPDLFPLAIEGMLRFTRRDVEMQGQMIPAGKVVLALLGSANHDPKQFRDPNCLDITRDPNPHVAFGHGIHFCLGAALARLESRVALTEFLERVKSFELASVEPWEPRKGLHVHGPTHLPIRFDGAQASLPVGGHNALSN